MNVIKVPRPPQSAHDPDRPVSSLLKSQAEHLREAESKLPLRYRDKIETYVKAIKTEGEAARYIRDVTEAIHNAHHDAERARRAPKRPRGLEIAAVADQRAERERAAVKRAKTSGKTRRKKQSSS